MPRVKSFSSAQNRKRDEIAKAIKREGGSESSAYAIATAQVKRSKRRKKSSQKIMPARS